MSGGLPEYDGTSLATSANSSDPGCPKPDAVEKQFIFSLPQLEIDFLK